MRPKLNLEDQISVFMSPRDSVAQLYHQAPGSLFVSFCDSQGFGRGILTRLHMWFTSMLLFKEPAEFLKDLWTQCQVSSFAYAFSVKDF
jgi:hypothetical protein